MVTQGKEEFTTEERDTDSSTIFNPSDKIATKTAIIPEQKRIAIADSRLLDG